MTWKLTSKLSDKICLELSEGKSLVQICSQDGMPARSSVLLWVVKGERGDPEYQQFSDSYARAREAQAHALIDEVIEIADDKTGDKCINSDGKEIIDGEFVARSRIKIDTRFKVAARMHHKKFGDKITNELTGKDGGAIEITTELTKEEMIDLAKERGLPTNIFDK